METVNCPRCGRVFTKVRKGVCPTCVKEDEETFEGVRLYVKENPLNTVHEVSEATQVPVKRILQYIKDGRLETSGGMDGDVVCSQCGKPIRTGRFCEKCALEIKTNLLQQPKTAPKTKTGGRMHAIDLNK